MTTLSFERQGRSRRAIAVLLGIWAGLLALLLAISAALWIIVFLWLFTLPLAWEVWRNPQSRLTLTARELHWQGIIGHDTIPLTLIKKVRFDRRLDMSMRVTLVLRDGRKIRLPHDVLPPYDQLEAAFQANNIPTERNPFALMG